MNWVNGLPGSGPEYTEVEHLLINHCSSVLFGGKASALFIVRTEKCYSLLLDLVIQLDTNVSLTILKKIQKGFLVLLYKPDTLYGVITEPDTQEALTSFGYSTSGQTLQSYLAVLKARLCQWNEFPHEIGFFLGYPSEDVVGFIQQKGQNYKYCGLWKVYGDVRKALTLFHHYENCREKTRNLLSKGHTRIYISAKAKKEL
jgi:hypothetical protein